MQSRCLISIIFEDKEMLVYETKLIKLSRMLSMSRITRSVFFTKYSVSVSAVCTPFSSFIEITDTKCRSINTRASLVVLGFCRKLIVKF